LEREHVRKCVRAEFGNYNLTLINNIRDNTLNDRNRIVETSKKDRLTAGINAKDDQLEVKESTVNIITDQDIESIVDEHVYEPPGYKKYSSSGCKRVPFLVRTFISKKKMNSIE
jgi:hypothetical protein